MVMIDGSGQVQHLNAAAEGLFGYSKSDLVGRSMEILVPEIVRGKHKQLREGSFSSPVSRPMGKGRRLSRRHKDGHEIPVSVGLNPVTIGSNPVVVIASFVDNSAQERAQRAELLSLSVHRMFGVSRTRRTRLPFARATFAVSLGIAWGDVILNSTPRLEPSSAPSASKQNKASSWSRISSSSPQRLLLSAPDAHQTKECFAELFLSNRSALNPFVTGYGFLWRGLH